MSAPNYILDSSNDQITVTNLFAGNTPTKELSGVPLTTSDGSATGQIVVAVKEVGAGTLPSGAATAAKQDTGNTSLASLDTKTIAPAQRTPTASVKTTNGSIALGCYKLTLVFSTDFAGTVLTAAYPAGLAVLTLDPPSGDTLAAVAYTISAGNMTAYEVR